MQFNLTACGLKALVHIPQALLSAHDTVAHREYGPILPPMPDELPEDEEATRTVCLVKNNQPLVSRRSHLPREGNIELAVSVCSYMCSNVLIAAFFLYGL